jgi:N utilization substance protein B
MTAAESRWDARRRAREAALRLLYLAEVGRLDHEEAETVLGGVGPPDAPDLPGEALTFATDLARGAWADRAAIDAYLADASHNWRVERLAVVDRLILRLGVHEMRTTPDTPPRVVIDQAIELARLYSGDDGARFVNGVLDGVFRKLKEEGLVAE